MRTDADLADRMKDATSAERFRQAGAVWDVSSPAADPSGRIEAVEGYLLLRTFSYTSSDTAAL